MCWAGEPTGPVAGKGECFHSHRDHSRERLTHSGSSTKLGVAAGKNRKLEERGGQTGHVRPQKRSRHQHFCSCLLFSPSRLRSLMSRSPSSAFSVGTRDLLREKASFLPPLALLAYLPIPTFRSYCPQTLSSRRKMTNWVRSLAVVVFYSGSPGPLFLSCCSANRRSLHYLDPCPALQRPTF